MPKCVPWLDQASVHKLWRCPDLFDIVCGAAALPLKEDYEEAGPVYGSLCGLVTNAETAPKVANLMPQIVQVSLSSLHHLADHTTFSFPSPLSAPLS